MTSLDDKAREHWVTIRHQDDSGRLVADVIGSTGEYVVKRSAGGHWWCDCPAGTKNQRCSHVVAVQLAVLVSETIRSRT